MASPTTSVKLKNKAGTDVTYNNINEIEVLNSSGSSIVFSYANFSGITATAADVMTGKYFLNANKELVEGTKTLVPLNSPTISISGSILSLEDGNNGSFSENYKITVAREGLTSLTTTVPISTTSYDIENIGTLASGNHAVSVSVLGTGMGDSTAATATYQKPLIAPTLSSSMSRVMIQSNDSHTEMYNMLIDGVTSIDIDPNYIQPLQDGNILHINESIYTATKSNEILALQ